MSDSLRQDERVGELTTPLGEDTLALVGFECEEGVSQKFEIRIKAVSSEKNLNFDTAIGQNCTISLKNIPGDKRYFCGAMTEARWLGGDDQGLHHYEMVLRPWLWLLSFTRKSYIHHDLTAPEIIEKVFGDHDFAVFTKNLSRDYPQLEYCVQYREVRHGLCLPAHGRMGHQLLLQALRTRAPARHGRRDVDVRDDPRQPSVLPDRRFAPLRQRLFQDLRAGAQLQLRQGQARRVRFQALGGRPGRHARGQPAFSAGALEVFDYPAATSTPAKATRRRRPGATWSAARTTISRPMATA